MLRKPSQVRLGLDDVLLAVPDLPQLLLAVTGDEQAAVGRDVDVVAVRRDAESVDVVHGRGLGGRLWFGGLDGGVVATAGDEEQ
jgi:hypothetical protein